MCPSYLSLYSLVKRLTSSQDPGMAALLAQLKSTVCNKSARKICCDELDIKETTTTTTITTRTTLPMPKPGSLEQPPDIEACPKLVRDFPNALDNHKICNKVKEAGQFLDWLRDNRNLCEQPVP